MKDSNGGRAGKSVGVFKGNDRKKSLLAGRGRVEKGQGKNIKKRGNRGLPNYL